ncbi:MAG: class I SAM-dependent methyltransferase [Anaerolineae bacterium]|nr:class I SAM-dependent methyltransferase [Anaerolineae bacterium]
MVWHSLKLRCPECGALLEELASGSGSDEGQYTVLTCDCQAYPVIAGIPIIQPGRGGRSQKSNAHLVSLIRKGAYQEALQTVLLPPPPPAPELAPAWLKALPSLKGIRALKFQAHHRAVTSQRTKLSANLLNPDHPLTACEFMDRYYAQAGETRRDVHDYFAYRFGQPRHLIALAFASLIDQPSGPILELACGCGHITRGLVHRANDQLVVGVDRNFFVLYVAKHWVAPEAVYICGDLDMPLPFSDALFSTVSCTDGFHYLSNKAGCMQEIRRVLQPDGLMLLNVLRNAYIDYAQAGQPLTPEAYAQLVADLPHRLVSDAEVLDRYLHRQGPALEAQVDSARLKQEPILSLVASRRTEIFQDYGPFDHWPHAERPLQLNPLYQAEKDAQTGQIALKRTFPSDFYQEDHAESLYYLPEQEMVSATFFDDLGQNPTPEIEALIGRCVVLGMPSNYAPL